MEMGNSKRKERVQTWEPKVELSRKNFEKTAITVINQENEANVLEKITKDVSDIDLAMIISEVNIVEIQTKGMQD